MSPEMLFTISSRNEIIKWSIFPSTAVYGDKRLALCVILQTGRADVHPLLGIASAHLRRFNRGSPEAHAKNEWVRDPLEFPRFPKTVISPSSHLAWANPSSL